MKGIICTCRWEGCGFLLLAALRLPRCPILVVLVVVLIILPVVFITLAELRCKGAVKEILASREIPFTHVLNISLLKRGGGHDRGPGFNVRFFGRDQRQEGLWHGM